jgi:hypothetical protein
VHGLFQEKIEESGFAATFQACTQEMLSWNLGWNTFYPDSFRDFSQSFQASIGIVRRLGNGRYLPHLFEFTVY